MSNIFGQPLDQRHTCGKLSCERCPKLLIIREMQTKSTVSYHYILMKMAKLFKIKKKTNNNKCWQICKVSGTLTLLVRLQIDTVTLE